MTVGDEGLATGWVGAVVGQAETWGWRDPVRRRRCGGMGGLLLEEQRER